MQLRALAGQGGAGLCAGKHLPPPAAWQVQDQADGQTPTTPILSPTLLVDLLTRAGSRRVRQTQFLYAARMPQEPVQPDIKRKSFSCPHCGAHTHQTWFNLYGSRRGDEHPVPNLVTQDQIDQLQQETEEEERKQSKLAAQYTQLLERYKRRALGLPFLSEREKHAYCSFDLENIHVSRCYTCGEPTIWRYDTILYPVVRYPVEPNPDMDDDIRADFDEARTLLDLSPRATAALLRLCLQKLCKQVGETGKDINADIKSLVAKGLDIRVQKALDLVRVVGNNAVHPGRIDLKDDRDTAAKLFELVNRIAYDMITHPRELEVLYNEKVPDTTKAAIKKRDGEQS